MSEPLFDSENTNDVMHLIAFYSVLAAKSLFLGEPVMLTTWLDGLTPEEFNAMEKFLAILEVHKIENEMTSEKLLEMVSKRLN